MIWILSSEVFPWILSARTHFPFHWSSPARVTFCDPVQSFPEMSARSDHSEVMTGGDTGATTPDSRVNRPPERTDPLRVSRSPTFARSISTSAADIDSGDPSVGNLTREVPSGWAI